MSYPLQVFILLACTVAPSEGVVAGPSDQHPVEETEEPVETQVPEPEYTVSWGPIPEDLAAAMQGTSMHSGCPVPMEDLVLLEPAHWDFEGQVQTGRLVVAKAHAEDLAGVFNKLFDARFAIRSMRPVSEFGGSDDASMEADNTSAFNCRQVTGGSSWSEHSYGHAIDINPVENPYVKGGTVLPAAGKDYLIRDPNQAGLIVEGDAVTQAFDAIGWGWGGRWGSLKDYQHFSATGN